MTENELRREFGNRAVDALLARISSGASPELDAKLTAAHIGLHEETAIKLLDAASIAGLVDRSETRYCPACEERLEAPDAEAELCPHCRKAFADYGGILTKVSYRLDAHRPRAIPWVIVIHGFNSHGKWQQDFSWRMANKLKYSAPVLIYKYGLIRFSVLARWRHRQLAKQLGTAIRTATEYARVRRIPEPPDLILHSFGSQLFVQLLAMPEFDDLKFGRIIAAGTVIRPNYNWSERISQGRLEAVFCHCGGKDWAVPFAEYFIPGTGPGAREGFSDSAATNVINPNYGHGGCFELEELETNLAPGGLWDRFLRRDLSTFVGDPTLFRPTAWTPKWAPMLGGVRLVGLFLMALLATVLLTLLSQTWLAFIERLI